MQIYFKPPRINRIGLPDEELKLVFPIEHGLFLMALYATKFEDSIKLLFYIQQQRKICKREEEASFDTWPEIPARDGAMCLFHFLKSFETVKHCMHRTNVLKLSYNKAVAREATALFSKTFPDCVAMRDAICHTAQLTKDPENLASHAFSGNYVGYDFELRDAPQLFLYGFFRNDHYYSTIRNRIVKMPFTLKSLHTMGRIALLYYTAFYKQPFHIDYEE